MVNNISLQVFSLVYVIVLATVYFIKRRYNFLESKIYKTLLGITCISLLLDIANIYLTNNPPNIDSLSNIISLSYCISLFFWLVFFLSYLVLSMSSKKYERLRDLTKEHPFVYAIIILTIIIFAVLMYYEIGHIYNFIEHSNKDVQIIYLFGIVGSLLT